MTKLTKNQRDQLIVVSIGAVAAMAALWFFVVAAQEKELAATNRKSADMRTKLSGAAEKLRQADKVSAALTNSLDVLAQREADFAPEHEPLYWMTEKLTKFVLPASDVHRYKSASILDIKAPEITDKGVITSFPYKWARFHIVGQGFYHDFGKFIADFENHFPYFRIENLDVSIPGVRENAETLSYNFDIVTPQVPAAPETK